MAQKKKIPEIRFKEFTDSWSDQPLSYYLAVSEEKNSANQYDKYDIYSVSREYGVINQIEYQGKSFAGASLLNYRVVNPNEVVYTKSPLRAQPYGIIKTNKSDSGIVSALYGVFKPNEEVDPIFVQTYFELDSRLNEYLRPLVNKGAKNTLLISDEDSISGNVSFPKKEEQEKMVKLFTAIDKLIRKLEEKLEKLKDIKQSLLNQMFTDVNRGGWIPRIRFAGFNEEWDMKLLGSISNKVNEKNSLNEYDVVFTNSAEYGIIDQRDFFDRYIANAESINGYYIVHPNYFVYNSRISTIAPVGPINRNKLSYSGVMSPLYYVFRITEDNVNLSFLEKFFKSRFWHAFMYENGNSGARSDRFSISNEEFAKMPISLPKNKKEQKAIGEAIEAQEELIKTTEQKLERIRDIKQSLLKAMFVN